MAPNLLAHLRNPSQIFTKDIVSTSTVSITVEEHEIDTPTSSRSGNNTPPTMSTLRRLSRQPLDAEDLEPPVMPAAKQERLSLRKRFFSSSGTPVKQPVAQMTGAMDGLNMKEKLELLKLGGGKIDVGLLLHAIHNRFEEQFEEVKGQHMRRVTRYFPSQKEQYQWQEGKTDFPPHLASIPNEAKISLLNMFDLSRLIEATVAMNSDIPEGISSLLYGEPVGNTMPHIEARMRRLARQGANIGSAPSIGNRPDWFTDAVFAQQSFTGSNPTTITTASTEWLKRFMNSANMQGNKGMYTLLSTAPTGSIFIQDCSYFRNACHAEADSTLCSDDGKRFGCASVTMFALNVDGSLHPLAIILDYRVSMEHSVCIFNKRLTGEESTANEAKDWPWRYAKLCSQVADWQRHELATHLTDCHFVQEALIVGAQRSFPSDHVVFNLLAPHWARTLSINAAAREIVVPEFITKMNGLTTPQTYAFILDAYKRFNFTTRYIPTSLSRRGFPSTPSALASNPLLRNYVWAKNISMLWAIIHKFVVMILSTVYKSDDDVMQDKHVQTWCKEMHSQTGGQMPSFPDIRTLDELTNAVTMCIHIASPGHASVNDLQGYYQSFVPNKPASLAAPLPTKLSELLAFGEKDFVKALPVNDPKVWRMCEQLPHLLSGPIGEEMSLAMYAKDVEMEAKEKKGAKWEMVGDAAITLGEELMEAGVLFQRNCEMMDDRDALPYRVLDPERLAVSIMM